jgi:hypothetical protein
MPPLCVFELNLIVGAWNTLFTWHEDLGYRVALFPFKRDTNVRYLARGWFANELATFDRLFDIALRLINWYSACCVVCVGSRFSPTRHVPDARPRQWQDISGICSKWGLRTVDRLHLQHGVADSTSAARCLYIYICPLSIQTAGLSDYPHLPLKRRRLAFPSISNDSVVFSFSFCMCL